MSNFLPLVNKKYEFEGDTVTVSFSRLTRQQMLAITPFLPTKDGGGQTIEEQLKLMDATINALETNIDIFTGLKDSNGGALTFEAIVNQAYFTTFVSGIAGDLLKESSVEDEKKSSNSTEPSTKS